MKYFAFILAILLGTTPAWAGRKITVGQLEDLLRSMQQEKKTDIDTANSLKQVELSEQLTRARMNTLVSLVPGPLTTEQVYVFEALSADLVPPASDLPGDPAPDEAAQKALMDKVASYVTRTYEQLPGLTATRTTLRFQDNFEAIASSSGINGSAKEMVTSSGFSSPLSYIRYINSSERAIASVHGVEKFSSDKDKTAWGANKMIALEQPDPALGQVFSDAQAGGGLHWLRWELINGKKAAVFAFEVPRPKSHLQVDVCCFPRITDAGKANFYTATTAATLGGGATGGGVSGNFQTNTDWRVFKTDTAYHGEIFVEPGSGIVLRLITEAQMKPTDLVHQLNTRIDYGAVTIGRTPYIVPVKTVVNSIVVPNGDSGDGGYRTRCTLFTTEYKDYQLEGNK